MPRFFSPALLSVHLGIGESAVTSLTFDFAPHSYPRYSLDVEEGWSPRGFFSPYELSSYLLFLARAASRGGPPRPETFLRNSPFPFLSEQDSQLEETNATDRVDE